ncbi:DUF4145 domain-containing protein [Rhizobium rhizogenes]|uniref:DUF4145 domain-containing protein n=1 Tax=Rhizobium rhizogenes TaxID=359 RepID=UPI001573FD45|nr:DUF4145 domain-containing protein [Rhizobium rhizogenes]NTF80537.1 DUF4145 domain-containing protein [Rhizobium rhizogenes]
MALLKFDCPRCSVKHATFDIYGQNSRGIVRYGWAERFEVFGVCRACHKSSILVIDNRSYEASSTWSSVSNSVVQYKGYLNDHFDIVGYVNLKDQDIDPPPEHVPEVVGAIFTEGAACVSLQCWNAAGAMFRLAIDLTTKSLLPLADQEPNAKIRRSLGLRLEWLFANHKLPSELADLADCIKEDGNDGAHDGSLTQNEALDLRDFTFSLLERLYTVPKRIELAAERRRDRRSEQ